MIYILNPSRTPIQSSFKMFMSRDRYHYLHHWHFFIRCLHKIEHFSTLCTFLCSQSTPKIHKCPVCASGHLLLYFLKFKELILSLALGSPQSKKPGVVSLQSILCTLLSNNIFNWWRKKNYNLTDQIWNISDSILT